MFRNSKQLFLKYFKRIIINNNYIKQIQNQIIYFIDDKAFKVDKIQLVDFIKNLNFVFKKQFNINNLEEQFEDKNISQWYKIYLDIFQKYHAERIKSKVKPQVQLKIQQNLIKIKNLFSSKVNGKIDIVQDIKLKPLMRYQRRYFSPELKSWEIDIIFIIHPTINKIIQQYLFCINFNIKYLVVFPFKDKSANEPLKCIKQLKSNKLVSNIRSDGESALGRKQVKDYLKENDINYFYNSSSLVNKNRVVESVVRTIRNAFQKDPQLVANNKQLQQVVDDFNNTKHNAFKQKFSPKQVNENEDQEGIGIRYKIKKLTEAKELQCKVNLLDLKQGNIITIHLDLKKTTHGFEKQRRQFNVIATFIKYEHEYVVCELLKPYNDIKIVEVPIYYTHNVANYIETLKKIIKFLNQFDIFYRQISRHRKLKTNLKVGRPMKYFTEQEAQEMAKKQRGEAKKRQRLK